MKLKLHSFQLSEEKPWTMFLWPCFRLRHFYHLLKSVGNGCKTGEVRTGGSAESMNCWIPAGPSADCIPLKRIKTEPPDGEIIQVTVPGECLVAPRASSTGEGPGRGAQEGTQGRANWPASFTSNVNEGISPISWVEQEKMKIDQGCPNYSLWANCGPLTDFRCPTPPLLNDFKEQLAPVSVHIVHFGPHSNNFDTSAQKLKKWKLKLWLENIRDDWTKVLARLFWP